MKKTKDKMTYGFEQVKEGLYRNKVQSPQTPPSPEIITESSFLKIPEDDLSTYEKEESSVKGWQSVDPQTTNLPVQNQALNQKALAGRLFSIVEESSVEESLLHSLVSMGSNSILLTDTLAQQLEQLSLSMIQSNHNTEQGSFVLNGTDVTPNNCSIPSEQSNKMKRVSYIQAQEEIKRSEKTFNKDNSATAYRDSTRTSQRTTQRTSYNITTEHESDQIQLFMDHQDQNFSTQFSDPFLQRKSVDQTPQQSQESCQAVDINNQLKQLTLSLASAVKPLLELKRDQSTQTSTSHNPATQIDISLISYTSLMHAVRQVIIEEQEGKLLGISQVLDGWMLKTFKHIQDNTQKGFQELVVLDTNLMHQQQQAQALTMEKYMLLTEINMKNAATRAKQQQLSQSINQPVYQNYFLNKHSSLQGEKSNGESNLDITNNSTMQSRPSEKVVPKKEVQPLQESSAEVKKNKNNSDIQTKKDKIVLNQLRKPVEDDSDILDVQSSMYSESSQEFTIEEKDIRVSLIDHHDKLALCKVQPAVQKPLSSPIRKQSVKMAQVSTNLAVKSFSSINNQSQHPNEQEQVISPTRNSKYFSPSQRVSCSSTNKSACSESLDKSQTTNQSQTSGTSSKGPLKPFSMAKAFPKVNRTVVHQQQKSSKLSSLLLSPKQNERRSIGYKTPSSLISHSYLHSPNNVSLSTIKSNNMTNTSTKAAQAYAYKTNTTIKSNLINSDWSYLEHGYQDYQKKVKTSIQRLPPQQTSSPREQKLIALQNSQVNTQKQQNNWSLRSEVPVNQLSNIEFNQKQAIDTQEDVVPAKFMQKAVASVFNFFQTPAK